jgi:hypothetical protein
MLDEWHAAAYGDARRQSSWNRVDLGPILRGEVPDDLPTMWKRSDGFALLYPGKVHAINAESESGKTWMALHACAERMLLGEHVVFIDFEDSAPSVVRRLVDLGVPVDVVEVCFGYIRPDDPLTPADSEALVAMVRNRTASLVVVDGVTEAMVLHGFSINDNDDVARFIALLPRPLQRTGAAVLLLDHVTKARDARGGYAIGAQHKRGGIDGAIYTATVERLFGRGKGGSSKLEVSKDRPGHVRGALSDLKRVGSFRLVQDGDQLRSEIVPPGSASVADPSGEPDADLAARIAYVVAAYGQSGVSFGNVVETVQKKRSTVGDVLTWLEDQGYISCERGGSGRANTYRSVRPYGEVTDGP